MTEIDLHIVARMADYMATHPYDVTTTSNTCCMCLLMWVGRRVHLEEAMRVHDELFPHLAAGESSASIAVCALIE